MSIRLMGNALATIWKFDLAVQDVQTVSAPVGWQPLTVANQRDHLVLWAQVDPDQPHKEYRVFVHGTGNLTHPEASHYIGSAQFMDGRLVWHVFWSGE